MRVFHISSNPTKEQDKECSQIRPYITVCAHVSTYNSTSDYASHVCSYILYFTLMPASTEHFPRVQKYMYLVCVCVCACVCVDHSFSYSALTLWMLFLYVEVSFRLEKLPGQLLTFSRPFAAHWYTLSLSLPPSLSLSHTHTRTHTRTHTHTHTNKIHVFLHVHICSMYTHHSIICL